MLSYFLVSKTKQSAAAVASSVLTVYGDEEKRNDVENLNNCSGQRVCSKERETVLVFSLEDDNEIGMLGLLPEEEVSFMKFYGK